MAIARAQQGGGGASNTLVIVFVAVAVVSLGFTIFLFTQQEDLRNQVTRAEGDRDRANQQANEARTALQAMAQEVLGRTDVADAELPEEVASAKNTVVESPALEGARLAPESSVIDVLKTLAGLYQTQSDQLRQARDELDRLKAETEQLSTQIAERKDAYDANAAQLAERVEALEEQYAEARTRWQEQVAELEQRLGTQADEAGQLVNDERRLREQLEEQLEKERARNQALQQELAAFKPQPDLHAALQRADGSVVRAIPGEDVVYIDLGRQDGISRGITFAVYPRLDGISADGKGKATIEVVQVFDTTSECKVTSRTSTQPVIAGDLIANPVYDRSRQYRFVVAGGFDLDFDGKIDDPNGERVAAMIRGWGGVVTGEVDTGTDFLVAGVPVTRVARPEGAEPEATDVREAQSEERRQAFESKLQEAKSLSIPILTRTQFLHFVGRPVPEGATDDRRPTLQ